MLIWGVNCPKKYAEGLSKNKLQDFTFFLWSLCKSAFNLQPIERKTKQEQAFSEQPNKADQGNRQGIMSA